ncbi:MAG: GC-type dockerin domain-anchored protein [Planctomycetota bacterium]
MAKYSYRTIQFSLLNIAAAGLAGLAEAQAHEALLLSDPADPTALWITNYYTHARGLAGSNVAWFRPADSSFQAMHDVRHAAVFGHLTNRRLEPSIDYLILAPIAQYSVSADGLVSDDCAPVTRFAVPASFTFSKFADDVLTAGFVSTRMQGFFTTLDDPIAFDANETYQSGQPGGSSSTGDLFIGASLGYTGQRGVSGQTIVDMIDRSVAADGQGAGFLDTFYFVETNDAARSGPRDGLFTNAVGRLAQAGLAGVEISPGPLPPAGLPALGVMTGAANLDIAGAPFTFAGGAFADHLTSWAADFARPQQTKMSRWIEKGAVGTFGTIQEPCAYPQKFPSAYLHSNYGQGLTLGESLLRSLAAIPFQGYFMGDPLCRPFATGPEVQVSGVPTGLWQGAISINATATPTRPGTGIGSVQALIDGVVVAEGVSGSSLVLPTAHLDDGWHELRVVATDDSPQRVIGEWVGSFTLSNSGLSAAMVPTPASGDLGTSFEFGTSWPTGTVSEVRIVHLGRVVAAGDGSGPLRVRGEVLGAGPARVWAEVDFASGTTVVTEPVVLDIANAGGGAAGSAVGAFSYTKRTSPGAEFVAAFPADFGVGVEEMSYLSTGGPAQAALLGGEGPYRIYRADAAASGTDTIAFTASDGDTTSTGQVTVVYRRVPVPCLADVNGDGAATPADFTAWVAAYNAGDPASDQNGDGVFGAGVPGAAADFTAWIINYNQGCRF